ncbi:MAG: vanadium-dependent haloperoxidase [Saprospiraceae bacterium]|nr:vanadium-dependent haloperoxidase [Saprospiraceae bacterium]
MNSFNINMKTCNKVALSGLLILCIFLIPSCKKDNIEVQENKNTEDYSADHLIDYYDQICKISKNTAGFFPPQVARVYGYIGLANYEAIVKGIPGAKSLHGQLNQFQSVNLPQPEPGVEYNWAIASNAATAEMIRKMFELNISDVFRNTINNKETSYHLALSQGTTEAVADRSKKLGKDIAEAVYLYSTTDQGHQSYKDPFQLPYSIPQDEFCWVPTGAITNPLSPQWGKNRPFLTVNVEKTVSAPHTGFSSDPQSEFYKEAMIVYNQVRNNTAEEVEIAKYWADDPFATCTPAGHTFNILTQILKEEKVSLAKASMAFAQMGIAENDAFIACWKGKYDYLLIRPVSYIKRYIDPSFSTVIGTPPFPAYTSGHSCEIGAASRILTRLFTDGSGNYQFTDYSQLQYGFYARSFSNFNEMALECANSRLYGGIHFPMDNIKGLQVGKAVGDNVNKEISWPSNVR